MKSTINKIKISAAISLAVFFLGIGASEALAGSATLNWNANSEADLAGYKIYYDTVSHSGNCPAGFGSNVVSVGKVTTYTFNNTLTDGVTYYFQIAAYDTSNNISTCSAQVTKAIPSAADTAAPTLSAFVIPSTATSLTVSISTLTASDNVAVTGYYLSESSGTPATSASAWTSTKPTSYTFSSAGTKTLYAWAKDAAGNISTSRNDGVVITLPTSDTIAPVTTAAPLGGTYTTAQSVTLTANEASTIYYTTDGATPTTASTVYTGAISIASSKTLKYFARDMAGNSETVKSQAYVINLADTTKPTVNTFSIPSTASSLTVSITAFTATDNIGVTGYKLTESATAPTSGSTGWTSTAPTSYIFTSAGTKTLYGWAKDSAGNVSNSMNDSVVITLSTSDTTNPVASITTPENNWIMDSEISYIASATDNVGVVKLEYYVDGTLVYTYMGSSYLYRWNTTSVSNGSHVLVVKAYDAAGNMGQSPTATITVNNAVAETTAPVTTASPLGGTYTTAQSVALTANETATIYYTTDGSTPTTGSSVYSSAISITSTKTLKYFARDTAGNNETVKTQIYTINLATADTTRPVVTFVIPPTTSSLIVPVTTFTATDNVGVAGYLINTTYSTPSALATGWTSTAPTSYIFTSAGTKTLYGWAKDVSGNISSRKSDSVTITLPASDTTLPTVSILAPVNNSTVSGTSATISASASDNMEVIGVKFKLDGTDIGNEDTISPYSITWNTTQSANGSHTITATARDSTGNQKTSNSVTVTVSNASPTLLVALASVPTLGSAPLNSVSLIANVTGTQPGNINYTFYCNRSDVGTNVTTPFDKKQDNSPQTSYTASGLCSYINPGTYTAKVVAERGTMTTEARYIINVSSPTASAKFVTQDKVRVSSDTVNVRSSASAQANPLGTQAAGKQGTITGGPTYADGYWWWNINYDAGTDGWSVENYLEKVTADAQAPTVPAGLSATPTSPTRIGLSWTASTDDTGVAGYTVFRNGVQIATATNAQYANEGLSAATAYSYEVSAYDAAGNESNRSTKTTATTQAAQVIGGNPGTGNTGGGGITPPITPPTGNEGTIGSVISPIITPTGTTTMDSQVTPPTTSTSAGYTQFGPYITRQHLEAGSKGEDVKELQDFLKLEGYLTVSSTGFYGAATRKAVEKFQENHGIANPGDEGFGEIGARTRAVMNQYLATAKAPVASGSANTVKDPAFVARVRAQILLLQQQLVLLLEELGKMRAAEAGR